MDALYTPLSGIDMKRLIPDARVMTYKQLRGCGQLPELPLVILYETRPGVGHWVVILKTPEGIEHFDSYGMKPDGELSFVPIRNRALLGADQPHLVKLLLDTMQPINFSDWRLQSKGRIATCGRWCVLRAKYRELTSDAFGNLIKTASKKIGLKPDILVSSVVR